MVAQVSGESRPERSNQCSGDRITKVEKPSLGAERSDDLSDSNEPFLSYADLIIAYLAQIGVEYVFGVPGGAIEPFYNALARREQGDPKVLKLARLPFNTAEACVRTTKRAVDGPRSVVARHEAGAAFMADGYTRETGRLGVCTATTGPGATNLITGVASAYADGIPMLVITPQTALPNFGRRSLQESSVDAIDTVSMFEYCTRYNTFVSHAAQLEQKLVAAVAAAYRAPQGPAHLSIPMDILAQAIAPRHHLYDLIKYLRQPMMIDMLRADELCNLISKVLLHNGQGIAVLIGQIGEKASLRVQDFCEKVKADFVATPTGKTWVDSYHPNYRGIFGFAGHASARAALMADDIGLILAVGVDMGELSTNGWDTSALLNEKLVHIDSSPQHFHQSYMAALHVQADYMELFADLLEFVQHAEIKAAVNGWQYHADVQASSANHLGLPSGIEVESRDCCLNQRADQALKPQQLMLELVNVFPEHTRFVIDAGNAWCWATHYLHPKEQGRYHIAMGFGAMAWAVGAAVGTALGAAGEPVVCLTGDGSYLMSAQEITVAQAEGLNLVYIILNDQALGMVKHGQRLGGGEPIAFELPPVDFAAMAMSMGIKALNINTLKDWHKLDIEALFAHPGPVLLDVSIDSEEVPPMGRRVDILRK